MREAPTDYVSIAWTRPVNWLRFTDLPRDIDAAAAKSRTIRYQRDLIRRWVQETQGRLVHEEAVMELSPDRATPQAVSVIEALRRQHPSATFLAVAFPRANGWRPHVHLEALLLKGRYHLLDPDPYISAAFSFDPSTHFSDWETQNASHRGQKACHRAEILAAIATLDPMSLTRKADALNERGLTTHTGKAWTKDNLAKFLSSPAPMRADPAG
ncbi:hypothetical protein ACFOHK_15555 [Falsigemmobacter intermedius]|uniref:Recombinase domain-containing protein n=2 Tax=Falsigemmobacter intermedius TaxID=1553448 RepID=A0A3S3TUB7_9RHOB|nr:hypothetical protein [Falsigemmobacter intermedius]RWY33848.1 hypothetical protein EP867_19525 [Falsigemmobacter intermedius]